MLFTNNMSFENIKEIVESIVLIIGIPLVIIQIYQVKKQMKYQVAWNKKNVTFEYIDRYTNEIRDINKKIIKDLNLIGQEGEKLTNKKLKKLLEDASFRADIMSIVAYFDHLALGISNDYFDNKIAKASLIVMVIETFKAMRPYIKYRRKELNANIASHFEDLYNLWENN